MRAGTEDERVGGLRGNNVAEAEERGISEADMFVCSVSSVFHCADVRTKMFESKTNTSIIHA